MPRRWGLGVNKTMDVAECNVTKYVQPTSCDVDMGLLGTLDWEPLSLLLEGEWEEDTMPRRWGLGVNKTMDVAECNVTKYVQPTSCDVDMGLLGTLDWEPLSLLLEGDWEEDTTPRRWGLGLFWLDRYCSTCRLWFCCRWKRVGFSSLVFTCRGRQTRKAYCHNHLLGIMMKSL